MATEPEHVELVESRLGDLEFTHGFAGGLPTAATVERLYDELDFQRACQAYLWGIPIVAFAEWQASHENLLGAASGDVVASLHYTDKLGILTANTTTPYFVSFANLAETGPFLFEMPAGLTSGLANDMWQRPIVDMGTPGLDRGKGGKYLFLGPGQDAADCEDYTVVRSATFNIIFGFQTLDPDPGRSQATLDALRLYRLSQSDSPPPTRIVDPAGRPYLARQPPGFAYWERLAAILEQEPIEERDRFFHAMLKPLQIEKGSPFAPDERRRTLLTDAALVGEAMAKTTTFGKRRISEPQWPEGHWHQVVIAAPDQRAGDHDQLDERASMFYEAITNSKVYLPIPTMPGVGQAYIAAYKDAAGRWLEGSGSYRLRVPADPPAKLFWSLTVYDIDTRCLTINDQQIADLGSRDPKLVSDPDHSVELYFGPTAPDGLASNWIPTPSGKNWFAYFRFYGPTEPYFDQSWQLPDIELIG